MSSAPRKPAPRAPKPVGRYWAGKAPKGARDLDSDDDDEDDAPVQDLAQPDVALDGEQDILAVDDDEDELVAPPAAYKPAKAMNLALKDVNISREGKVIVAGRQESGRTAEEQGVLFSSVFPHAPQSSFFPYKSLIQMFLRTSPMLSMLIFRSRMRRYSSFQHSFCGFDSPVLKSSQASMRQNPKMKNQKCNFGLFLFQSPL
jgi:hypothetical protein